MNRPTTLQYGDYRITTDRTLFDVAAVHRYLSEESYWAQGIPFELVERSFEHSFVIGVLHGEEQVGYARLVTDYATFGYLADVFVLDAHRGQGLSKKMMGLLMGLPWVGSLRHLLLATADAHGLYAQFGFAAPARPERLMQIIKSNPYITSTSGQSSLVSDPPVSES
jgi:GNAT superfamily N-acetyltransferase